MCFICSLFLFQSPPNKPKWNAVSKTRSLNSVYNPKMGNSTMVNLLFFCFWVSQFCWMLVFNNISFNDHIFYAVCYIIFSTTLCFLLKSVSSYLINNAKSKKNQKVYIYFALITTFFAMKSGFVLFAAFSVCEGWLERQMLR